MDGLEKNYVPLHDSIIMVIPRGLVKKLVAESLKLNFLKSRYLLFNGTCNRIFERRLRALYEQTGNWYLRQR